MISNLISKFLNYLASDDGKVYALAGANAAGGVGQAVLSIESVLKVILLLIQIVIGVITAVYIYRKAKAQKKEKK